ncbi:hypothetical protein CH06BL_19110 [Chromobacterium haemolyticum]|nr:hypothetical protein CH06BL_19110 [Chromobacterium haemolyticum]
MLLAFLCAGSGFAGFRCDMIFQSREEVVYSPWVRHYNSARSNKNDRAASVPIAIPFATGLRQDRIRATWRVVATLHDEGLADALLRCTAREPQGVIGVRVDQQTP